MINDDIIQKIDILVEELCQLKRNYQSQLDAKEEEIVNLLKKLNEREQNLQNSEQKVQIVEKSLEEDEKRITFLTGKVEDLERKVETNEGIAYNIQDLWDQLEGDIKTQKSYSENIDSFLAQYSQLKKSLDELTSYFKKIQVNISKLSIDCDTAQNKHSSLVQMQKVADEHIGLIENKVRECTETLTFLQEKLSNLDSLIKNSVNTELKIDEFKQQQTSIEKVLNDIKKYISSAQPIISQIDEKLKLFVDTESKVISYSNNLDALKIEFDKLNSQINDTLRAEKTIETFIRKQSNHSADLSRIDNRIADSNNSLDKIVSRLNSLESTLRSKNREFDDVISKCNNAQRSLSEMLCNKNNLENFIINTVGTRMTVRHETFQQWLTIYKK